MPLMPFSPTPSPSGAWRIEPLDRSRPADVAFVASTWSRLQGPAPALRSHYERGRLILDGEQARDGYWRSHPRFVDRMLARPSVTVLCAVVEDPIGWMAFEPISGGGSALHFVFTAKTLQRWGVARSLLARLPEGTVTVTAWTRACAEATKAGKWPAGWTWDPWWLMGRG